MKYFTFEEFERSQTAQSRGISNRIPPSARMHIRDLVDNILDPLREAWGKPLTVTSGYRCAALNKAVGGAASSQHISGRAADITAGSDEDNRSLYELCKRLKLPYDQLIGLQYKFGWLHVSYDPKRNRRQAF